MTVTWLPVRELEVGHLYRLDARRQQFGVWSGTVFLGIQWEFGAPTLFYERHWDTAGSAKPLEDVGARAPDSVRLTMGWTACEVCSGHARFDREAARYEHLEPTDHEPRVEHWTLNAELFEWLSNFEDLESPTA